MSSEGWSLRIFKGKSFVRFARKEVIGDRELCRVARDIERGRIDADLGGGVIKQRLSRPNEGKSGGYRAIILYRVAIPSPNSGLVREGACGHT